MESQKIIFTATPGETLKNMLENYTEEHKRKDLEIEKSLKKLATLETTKENRYVNLVIKEV